jgi:hypothetical protein
VLLGHVLRSICCKRLSSAADQFRPEVARDPMILHHSPRRCRLVETFLILQGNTPLCPAPVIALDPPTPLSLLLSLFITSALR